MESRGPHGYGCSSCFIHDKMSCAEIRDSVRGKKAVLEPVPFHRASHQKFEHRHVQRPLLCSEGVWQFGYPSPRQQPPQTGPHWRCGQGGGCVAAEPGWEPRSCGSVLGAPGPSAGPGRTGAWPLTAHRTKAGEAGLPDRQRQKRWTKVINRNCSGHCRLSVWRALLSLPPWTPSTSPPCEAVELTNETES